MEYIIIDTQEVVSQGELRRRNSNVSFPAVWDKEVLEYLGIEVVFPSPQPVYDPITQFIQLSAPVKSKKGNYEQVWTIFDLDDDTITTNKANRLEQLTTSIINQVQLRLDTFAKEKGYDNMLSAATYATSAITNFKNEGKQAIKLRDQTWSTLYSILSEVEAGTRTINSFADIESDLPVLEWL